MSNVFEFPKKKEEQFYFLDHCSGCQKEIEEDEEYREISMPYMNKGTKHIALCKSCYGDAKEQGIF